MFFFPDVSSHYYNDKMTRLRMLLFSGLVAVVMCWLCIVLAADAETGVVVMNNDTWLCDDSTKSGFRRSRPPVLCQGNEQIGSLHAIFHEVRRSARDGD